MENSSWKKPKILCLHGGGSSAKILQEEMKRWPDFVLEMMDLVYIDAPFLRGDKSGKKGKFDPPYYEWFQAYEVRFSYINLVQIFQEKGASNSQILISKLKQSINELFDCRISQCTRTLMSALHI